MANHLQDLLPDFDNLSDEAQEEAIVQIKALLEALQLESIARRRSQSQQIDEEEQWIDPAGTWSDLPDDMLDTLDKMRHASAPTPPLDTL